MFKKITILLLVLIICVNQIALPVSASTAQDFEYTETNGEITLTKYLGSGVSEVSIPGTIDGKPVTGIADNIFTRDENTGGSNTEIVQDNIEVKKIIIPENVRTIGRMFANCPYLQSVEMPSTLSEIQNSGFLFVSNRNLESINVSANNMIYSSENGVLINKKTSTLLYYPKGKKNSEYSIPPSVRNIGTFSILNDYLKIINVHANVEKIFDFGIYNGDCLESINVSDQNPYYISCDGILYSKDKSELIVYPSGKNNTEFVIPSSVSIVGNSAIQSNYLQKITVSQSVYEIFQDNFIGMNLKDIDVDENNPKFSSEDGILFDKEKTKLIKYPAYKDNSVYSIPIGTERICKYAFYRVNKVERVNVPGTVKNLEDMTFAGCVNLNDIYFYGDAPSASNPCNTYVDSPFKYHYLKGSKGFTDTWWRYPAIAFEGIKYEVISEPKFETVRPSSEGLMAVLSDTKDPVRGKLWGYMDTTGKIVIEPQFKTAGDFHEGVAYVKDTDSNKAKIIDKTGNVVIDAKELIPESVTTSVYYSSASGCSEGLIGFNENDNGCTNFYDINKNFVVGNTEETTMWLNPFSEGVSCGVFYNNKDKTHKTGFIDKTGKVTYTSNELWLRQPCFDQGLVAAGDMDENGELKCGFIDKSGSYAIPPKFDNVSLKYRDRAFFDGLAVVSINGKWGAIDKTGEFVISPVWDDMQLFSEGLAKVKKDNMWGAVNTKGELVIKPVYGGLTNFSNGLALAEKNHKLYWINKCGEYLGELKEQVDVVGEYIEEGVLQYRKDNLCGAIKITSKFSYQDFAYTGSNGEITITKYIGSGASELSIPETIDGKPVTAIADNIFGENGKLINKIIIPENVRTVGNIFYNCPNLISVEIPSTVVEIKNTPLMLVNSNYLEAINVSIDNKYYSSEDGVVFTKDKSTLIFYPGGKKDTSYSIPLSVTKIESSSLRNSFLKTININENVGEVYLNNLLSLETINVSDGNPFFTSFEGVLYSKDKTKLIAYPANKSGTDFVVPSNVKSIESQAIRSNNLKKITVTENVCNISRSNFNSCYALQNIEVDKRNLNYSSQDGVLFDKDKHSLIKYPENKKDEVYSIPVGVENIQENTFVSVDFLLRVNVPNTVKKIENFAFDLCGNLKGIYFYGDAPDAGYYISMVVNNKTRIYIKEGSKGFSYLWNGYLTYVFKEDSYPSPTPNSTIVTQLPANNINPPISGAPVAVSTIEPTSTPTQAATVTPTPTPVTATPTAKPSQTNEESDKKPAAIAFKDIQNHWALEQIIELSNKKVINGYEDGTFRPDNKINRAELAVIVAKVLGLKQSEGATKFKDDKDIPSWAKSYIKAATEAGILSGYGDNTFKANKPCSREEIVTMIMRGMKLDTSTEDINFKDAASIQSWAKGYVSKAVSLKIIKGYDDGTFKPAKDVTRAEAAAIVINVLKQLQ